MFVIYLCVGGRGQISHCCSWLVWTPVPYYQPLSTLDSFLIVARLANKSTKGCTSFSFVLTDKILFLFQDPLLSSPVSLAHCHGEDLEVSSSALAPFYGETFFYQLVDYLYAWSSFDPTHYSKSVQLCFSLPLQNFIAV